MCNKKSEDSASTWQSVASSSSFNEASVFIFAVNYLAQEQVQLNQRASLLSGFRVVASVVFRGDKHMRIMFTRKKHYLLIEPALTHSSQFPVLRA